MRLVGTVVPATLGVKLGAPDAPNTDGADEVAEVGNIDGAAFKDTDEGSRDGAAEALADVGSSDGAILEPSDF
jgi:hypothetical protein